MVLKAGFKRDASLLLDNITDYEGVLTGHWCLRSRKVRINKGQTKIIILQNGEINKYLKLWKMHLYHNIHIIQ